ncbi:hypothetical protein K1T71_014833 [Dendrolimus kikuchii]|nr:hypothetical protein K1T71_014833 [Dendrolimus kikuchii]
MGELQYPGPGVSDDERQYRAPLRRPQYRWGAPQPPPSAFAPWRRAPAPPRPPDYRRSASYPGKPDETFQERSGLDNMRSLEHYLTDIMRADTSDHMKGKSPFFPGVEEAAIAAGAAGAGSPAMPAEQTQDVVSRLSAAGLSMCVSALGSPARSSPVSAGSEHGERFSRKVFVGGLPPDIDEVWIVIHWANKEDVHICVNSETYRKSHVELRAVVGESCKFIFPRAEGFELAMIMDRLYGGVCYAGIDTDPELKYPKGAGRVAFSNQQSYIAAISARFVQLQHGDIDKRVEVKPYVLDDQMCDECAGARCGSKFAPFFCANVTCLQYYCEHCWATIHSRPGREFHKPLVKEGADRPRAVPFRWC